MKLLTKEDFKWFQADGVRYMYKTPFCGMFLPVGSGKTIVTLTMLEYLIRTNQCGRILIVGPKRVMQSVWAQEAAKWEHTKHLTFSHVLGDMKTRVRNLKRNCHIYLINIENLTWLVDVVGRRWPFDVIVCDEFSLFKSRSAKRSMALRALRTKGGLKRVIGLTGTPVSNGMLDLWNQLWILDKGKRLGYYLREYKEEFFYEQDDYGYHPIIKPGAQEIIHERIKDICFSVASRDVKDKPVPIINVVDVNLGREAARIYADLETEFFADLPDLNTVTAVTAAVLSNKLLQCTAGALITGAETHTLVDDAKWDALDNIIEESAGDPVLIYTWYKFERKELMKRYRNLGAEFLSDDPKVIERWDAKRIPILIAHPKSAGHGLNLQYGGHIMVFTTLPWSLDYFEQAIGRLARTGQKLPVFVHLLLANGTIDHTVHHRLTAKCSVQDALLEAVRMRKAA